MKYRFELGGAKVDLDFGHLLLSAEEKRLAEAMADGVKWSGGRAIRVRTVEEEI